MLFKYSFRKNFFSGHAWCTVNWPQVIESSLYHQQCSEQLGLITYVQKYNTQ